jgi:hypothetical protein
MLWTKKWSFSTIPQLLSQKECLHKEKIIKLLFCRQYFPSHTPHN